MRIHKNLFKTIQIVVPAVALLIIVSDILLDAIWGDAATYTVVIRSYIYRWPAFGVMLSVAMGALWAHFCWTPTTGIAMIRQDLLNMGCLQFKECSGHTAFWVSAYHGKVGDFIVGRVCDTAYDAWRDVHQQVKRCLALTQPEGSTDGESTSQKGR